MSKVERVVVGLGNPGERYEGTRHNIGWMVVERLAEADFSEWKFSKKHNADLSRSVDGKILLMRPHTFMNDSGQAVRSVLDFFKLAASDILVVTDDADLDFAVLRFRSKGSSAGQRGVQSIIEHVGTNQFARLKVGVGRPDKDHGMSLIDYVLAPFSKEQQELLDDLITCAVEEVKTRV